VPVPTKPELIAKVDDINSLIERQWTDQEVSEKLKRQNALHIKYSGVERDQLTKQLDMARARADEDAINRLQEKLDNLETPRLAFRTSLNSAKKKAENRGPTQQEKLALLNAENRRKNAESVRKAQLMERARARDEVRLRGEQAAGSGANTPGGTVFAASAAVVGNGNGGAGAVLPHILKLQEQQRSRAKAGVPIIHKPLMDDDIIGALDLDIDVEID
jgi:RNA polymerase-associated protein RTF1